ncbi:DNA-directed RNA polymerase I subunit RPA2 isoform X2 [Procambarus clarkii]|uniref:DNA-directed RNA polymerase I subunit RPA2 isoform X2 n=1 Tax=Procambarus clarkii TaxID=6728 RepID=UPI001E670540|nr:DNA-directed RNA polymerase I subunit RPA2-like isoform X2 [Procambarus clarkii]
MLSSKKTVELSLRHLKDPNFGKIPQTQNEAIQALAAPHVESFNFFLEEGLQAASTRLPAVEFATQNGNKISLMYTNIKVGKPRLPAGAVEVSDYNVYPKECIERRSSYTASVTATIAWTRDGEEMQLIEQSLGELPIMVRSKNCNLYNMSPKQLVKHGELVNETGGYFIINGGQRVLRLLTANRRNYPMAMKRETWKKLAASFTDMGIMMRCVPDDQASSINVLHYLSTGEAKLLFKQKKENFIIPLIMCLKALVNLTDHQIYQKLIKGRETDMYYSEKIKSMMCHLQSKGLYTHDMCREFIGKFYRFKLMDILPEWSTDVEICEYLLNQCVLIHLKTNLEKFDTLCLMTRKLYSFVSGECKAESPDAVSMQEVVLGGHTYLQLLKEKLMDILVSIKVYVIIKNKKEGPNWVVDPSDIKRAAGRGRSVGQLFQTFIATGTLPSKTKCGLMQQTGLTVILEHINRMRDLAHLRAIHRGSYFVETKVVEARRLTGEAWGFICPVHTPDGAPCGLLNHLTQNCIVLNHTPASSTSLGLVLARLGMTPIHCTPLAPYTECLEVVLDGCLVGYIRKDDSEEFTQQLRIMKAQDKIFKYTEIVLISKRKYKGQYPGLFLVTSVARMMRPVINLTTHTIEYIGTLEQLYLNVAVTPEDIKEGVHTHLEVGKTTIFSNIGKLVPFSDCNPNPRNMYQCQMGKQSMGTPIHNWRSQTYGKMYRLQSPQVPLVRNAHYDDMNMEDFCMGFNAVVAIISYTGYDMEDAMVLNKCAMERGLAHGQIYKTECVDLTLLAGKSRGPGASETTYVFRRDPDKPNQRPFIDANGLPFLGAQLTEGDPFYCVYDIHQKRYQETVYKGEDCVVDKYSIMSATLKEGECQKALITLRVKRNPIIGDKFASRSGQKGIMSRLYPVEDLPFSERGIIPDIIFNPHGIPSRMTAGGFNYYGEDVLYSGVDGRMIEVEIFEGIIYYQRLRHMTADKWQVRSKGSSDTLTRQPVKGRKRGGAIRFGEMERDCLISHGAAFTLKDRLLDCSDISLEWVCEKCGGLLTPSVRLSRGTRYYGKKQPVCVLCGPEAGVRQLSLPFAFKYLVAELASVGIKTCLGLNTAEDFISESGVRPH